MGRIRSLGTAAVNVDVFRPHSVVLLDRNIERARSIDGEDLQAAGPGAALHAAYRAPRLALDGDLMHTGLHRLDVRKIVGRSPVGIVVRMLVVPATQGISPLYASARHRRTGDVVDKPGVDLPVVRLSDLEVVGLGVSRDEAVKVARALAAVDYIEA